MPLAKLDLCLGADSDPETCARLISHVPFASLREITLLDVGRLAQAIVPLIFRSHKTLHRLEIFANFDNKYGPHFPDLSDTPTFERLRIIRMHLEHEEDDKIFKAVVAVADIRRI